jgi:hypothetical protein
MERVMIERGDFKIFHEPFAYVYYIHDKKATVPYMKIDPDHPQTYPDTKKWILEAAEGIPVSRRDTGVLQRYGLLRTRLYNE